MMPRPLSYYHNFLGVLSSTLHSILLLCYQFPSSWLFFKAELARPALLLEHGHTNAELNVYFAAPRAIPATARKAPWSGGSRRSHKSIKDHLHVRIWLRACPSACLSCSNALGYQCGSLRRACFPRDADGRLCAAGSKILAVSSSNITSSCRLSAQQNPRSCGVNMLCVQSALCCPVNMCAQCCRITRSSGSYCVFISM